MSIRALVTQRRTAAVGWLDRAGIWLALLVLCAAGSQLSPAFLTTRNLLNVLNQASVAGIVALGLTFVMVTGGVDLSVGSVITLSSAVGATVMAGSDANIPIAIVASLLVGALVGLINGLFVALRNVPSFILTLGTASLVQGAELLYTGGTAKGILAPWFVDNFGGTPALGLPTVAIVLVGVFLLLLLVQKFSVFGRHLFLAGSNPRAAELGGVPVSRTLVLAYILSGAAAGLAGVVLLARIGVSSAYAGQGYSFVALAMVVLGGTTFEGGRGGVVGTLAGILLLTVAFALVNIVGLTFYFQLIVEGVIIVGAAAMYRLLQRRM